jgi:hypothetical protein
MKDKRFPTVLGIIFLLIILGAGVYLSLNKTSLSSKASGTCEPVNPQIANLTYGSFDFSFLSTSTSCTATLSIDGKIFQDSSTVSTTHYFKVTNLKPVTSYKFSLISGGVTYSPPEFSLTTTTKPNTSIPDSNLAWGKVLNPDLTPVSGAIVFLTIPGGQALSAFTNKDGNWNISFATSFKDDKSDWFNPTSVTDEDLIVYSPDGKLTQLSNKTDNNDPVPNIIIGQKFLPVATKPTVAAILDKSSSTNTINLTITSPKESEEITTLRPDIFGQGPANASLKITLDGNSSNITVPSNNTWHWSPQNNLSFGYHKVEVSYQDKSVVRNFSVKQSESGLAFTATPSATLVPTQVVIPTKTPTISPTKTPTSSPSINPTKTPTLVPTTIPTKVPTVRAAKPSTTSALIVSGESFPTYFLIILSSLLFSVSLYYYRR